MVQPEDVLRIVLSLHVAEPCKIIAERGLDPRRLVAAEMIHVYRLASEWFQLPPELPRPGNLPFIDLHRVYADRQLGNIFGEVKEEVQASSVLPVMPWVPWVVDGEDIGYLSRLDLISEVFTGKGLIIEEAWVAMSSRSAVSALDPFIQCCLVREIAIVLCFGLADSNSIEQWLSLLAIRPWRGGDQGAHWVELTDVYGQLKPAPLYVPVGLDGSSDTLDYWILSTGGWNVAGEADYDASTMNVDRINWMRLMLWMLGVKGYEDVLDDWVGWDEGAVRSGKW